MSLNSVVFNYKNFSLAVFLTAVCLFSAPTYSLAHEPRCEYIFLNTSIKNSWHAESHTLDNWLSEDVERLFQSKMTEVKFPPNLPRVSKIEKLKNTINLRILHILKYFGTRSKNISSKGNSFLNLVHRTTERIKHSPFNFLVSGIVFQRIDNLINHQSLQDMNGNLTLNKFAQFHLEFLSDSHQDRTTYGADFFNEETIAQGAINTFAIKLFAFLNGHQVYSRDCANAISLLHPIVDAAMDKQQMSRETFQKLEKYLYQAENPIINSAYEKILFAYLTRFERDFPRTQVPGFWFALQRLFSAQVKSMKQKHHSFNEREYFEISLDKGGLSTVLAAYTALGPLTKKQFEFFYRSGGVFQVIDDLIDIQKDQKEGINTIWTNALLDKKGFFNPIQKLLLMETNIEENLEELTKDFSDPKSFQTVYSFGFELSFLRGLSRQKKLIDRSTLDLFSNHFTVTLNATQSLMTSKAIDDPNKEIGSDIWFLNQLIEMTNKY